MLRPSPHTRAARLAASLAALGLIASALLAGPRAIAAGRSPAMSAATVTIDLYATTGTLALPGSVSAPIWGYSQTNTPGSATLPGPVLAVNEGDSVTINLHNVNLPVATSLAIAQQRMVPDTVGVTAGNTKSYTFAAGALQPGTYLYEAGLTSSGPRQAAMGLFGALIVRPSACANCAYPITASNDSSYGSEAVVLLSEVDPAFNANPLGFEMSTYAPKYWLINGKAYSPANPGIPAAAGARLLLRYVNSGLIHHSMSLIGLHQRVVATDGKPAAYTPYQLTAETIPTGGSLDTIVTIPANAPSGARYALFDAAMRVDNNGARTSSSSTAPIAFGGMLTFITLSGASQAGGPATNNVALTNNPNNGSQPVTLSAVIGVSGDPAIDGAEYFVDTAGADGAGCAIAVGSGATPDNVSATIPTTGPAGACANLAALSSANHIFYVHGHNANGWGGFGSATLTLDKLGPATNALTLAPNPTNGSANVAFGATGDDTATGGSKVNGVEYGIDACPAGGSGIAMTLNTPSAPAPIAQFAATISAATVNGLSQGAHTIYAHSHDMVGSTSGNWGPCATIVLNVDKTAPTTSGVLAEPSPTNGINGVILGELPQEKLSASTSDPVAGGINSTIKAAEGFIDTVTANGTGINFLASAAAPNNGLFDSPNETVYAGIPLFAVQALSQGRHTVYIHALDAAGNWGPTASGILDVDKTGPTVTSATASPNPTQGAATVTLSAAATDPANNGTPANAPASNIVAAEWFDGVDPGVGLGTPMAGSFGATTVSNLSASINVSAFSLGTHNLKVRAKDAAGNWGPTRQVLLNVLPSDTIFADGFESGTLSAWNGGATGSGLSASGNAMVGAQAMQADITTNASRYVQDNSPNTADGTYRARFYFNPNGAATASGQQHDIFVALNTSGQTVIRVQYRRNSQSNNIPQVRVLVSRSGGVTAGSWYAINTNAANVIEVARLSGTSTTFTLLVNGTAHAINNLNTSASSLRVDTVRLGPQVGPTPPSGSTPSGTTLAGVTAKEYFDAFVSRRNNTLIGQ